MKNTVIPLVSYTAAARAVRYLASKGIRASAEKISRGVSGCTFGIRTAADPGLVCRLLSEIGIRCGDSMPVPPPPPHHHHRRPNRR